MYSRTEATNLMQGRYVSQDIVENGIQIQPWFKYEKKGDDVYGEIVRIALSENIDVEKQIIKASKRGFSFLEGINDLAKDLRSGNEISCQFSTGTVEYNCKLSLNATTGEFETTLLNSKVLQTCVIKDEMSKGRKL